MFIKSKIQFFESKSQPAIGPKINPIRCLSSQRYNFLKANHNANTQRIATLQVVYQVKDTIFWKQITTRPETRGLKIQLFIKSKIQFFESKSQRICASSSNTLGCLSSQRYNFLKANHNMLSKAVKSVIVVYQVKDTIFWKQITTSVSSIVTVSQLFIKSKIQFFESKSQRICASSSNTLGCLSSQRYNFLKANHNK